MLLYLVSPNQMLLTFLDVGTGIGTGTGRSTGHAAGGTTTGSVELGHLREKRKSQSRRRGFCAESGRPETYDGVCDSLEISLMRVQFLNRSSLRVLFQKLDSFLNGSVQLLLVGGIELVAVLTKLLLNTVGITFESVLGSGSLLDKLILGRILLGVAVKTIYGQLR
jgi:hypothetical protein